MNVTVYEQLVRKRSSGTPSEETVSQPGSRPAEVAPATRPLTSGDVTAFGLVELILKDRPRLETAIRRQSWQPILVPRLLAISLASFVLFGAAMVIVIAASGLTIRLTAVEQVLERSEPLMTFPTTQGFAQAWHADGGLSLIAAYAFGLIAATGVCLPSLYFYGLLAGVKLSMVEVVVHALKAKATTAVALVGILPVYVALVMGVIIFDAAPAPWVQGMLILGLCLPFIAGLWGTASLYRGFGQLADTLPESCRDRRACFLRRLVASWGACYTAVAPVMIFTIWQRLQAAGL